MSRALIILLLTLAGCASHPPAQVVELPTPEIIAWTALQEWLVQQQQVKVMTPDQVVSELVRVQRPESADELYYFGLLNQQLTKYASWTQARDAFRQLSQDETLAQEQRQLATILEEYNQKRINWHQNYRELLNDYEALQQQLIEARQDAALLEQKIQALTDLEAAISTRKEQ